MNRLKTCAAVLSAGLLAISLPALAHHSFAMFDQTKATELKGVTVVRFQWANPHVFLVVKSGGETFALECNSPSLMTQAGWKFNTLKAGDKVDISFFPLRNGKPGGALTVVTLGNGKKLDAW
ncbi:MAG: hypothetical protein KKD64_06390 [Alphaproteobacteria bacterium]|nr:hypothetical protein [Alphaproteobacteria bacterium]MBU0794215.1 hypothetical protein [Alphaproteobacteria bacterium]MBU0876566.1 hypothetical protein [Alphaproteobacteria bacterium]MBU1769267.1 hypothetical protein [Alphaproteobacteria bacterium]